MNRLGEVTIDTPNGRQSIIVGIGMRGKDIVDVVKRYQDLHGNWDLYRVETGVPVDDDSLIRMGHFIIKERK